METLTENIPTTFSADKTYSIEEYLEMEERSSEKYEFYNGKVVKRFSPISSTPNKNIIAANIIAQLNNEITRKNLNYFVLANDIKIQIKRFNYEIYSTGTIVCEKIEFNNDLSNLITNPLLIIEDYFQQDRFHYYKQIPLFKECLLIKQDIPYVISSFKAAKHTWQNTEAEGLESSIYLKSIDCTIDLKKIYRGIKF